MQEHQSILAQMEAALVAEDDDSLALVLRTLIEKRGWTILPGPACRADPSNNSSEERLLVAAMRFAAELPGPNPRRYHRSQDLVERALIAFAMERCRGNQRAAADYLGVHRNTMRQKLRSLGALPSPAGDAGPDRQATPGGAQQGGSGQEAAPSDRPR